MHLMTKTTLTTVLVTLGLALAAGAAEPPKLEAPADLDKLVGQPAAEHRKRLRLARAGLLILLVFQEPDVTICLSAVKTPLVFGHWKGREVGGPVQGKVGRSLISHWQASGDSLF